MWTRFLSDYGMLFVLLALCAVLSLVTWGEQYAGGTAGGEGFAYDVIAATPASAKIVIVVRSPGEDEPFTRALDSRLKDSSRVVVEIVRGQPTDARAALQRRQDLPARG